MGCLLLVLIHTVVLWTASQVTLNLCLMRHALQALPMQHAPDNGLRRVQRCTKGPLAC